MRSTLAIAAAFAVFYGWIRIVGNPHVVETVIGLILAAITFGFILYKTR